MCELATACPGRYKNTGHILPKGYESILTKGYEPILTKGYESTLWMVRSPALQAAGYIWFTMANSMFGTMDCACALSAAAEREIVPDRCHREAKLQ